MATAHVFLEDLINQGGLVGCFSPRTVSVPSTSNMAIVFGFNGAISSRPNQKNLDDDDDDDDGTKTGERERENERTRPRDPRCSFFVATK